MLKRIKYLSRFAPGLTAEDIGDIIETSQANNPKRGITGTLMTSGGVFLQVLEGPADQIDALYDTIRRDARHRDVLLLDSVEGATERMFPRWSLQKIDLDTSADMRLEPTRALLTAVMEQRSLLDKMVAALERAAWFEARTPKGATSSEPSEESGALRPTG